VSQTGKQNIRQKWDDSETWISEVKTKVPS